MLLVTLAIFALAAAVALGYFATSRPGGLFGGPRTIALTNVVGTRADDASRALADMGFTTKIETISSERVAAHLVIKQSPAPNGAIAPGTLVTLTVSAGPPRIPLMDVRQFSSDDAQRYLKIAKLVPRISSVYDASPKGTVLSQKPAAGTSVPIHSSVALVVSLGMHPVDAPDLVSLTLADARAAAAARHLRLVVGERDPSDSIPADVVTSQNPQAGSQIDRDGTIDVVISSGAPQITVPYVGGKSASDAVGTLGALGIAATIEYVVDPSAAVGTVLKQTPEPNTAVRKGSAVTLAVAVPGSVPDVAGKSPDDARALLQNAGYKIGNNAYVQEGTEGSVARTEPVAGSSLRPGETVTLYVSGTPTAPQ